MKLSLFFNLKNNRGKKKHFTKPAFSLTNNQLSSPRVTVTSLVPSLVEGWKDIISYASSYASQLEGIGPRGPEGGDRPPRPEIRKIKRIGTLLTPS